MSEVSFIIHKHLGVLHEVRFGDGIGTREINIVSWNNRPPKIEVRDWNSDHTRMSKGIGTFTNEEAEQLVMILTNYFRERSNDD